MIIDNHENLFGVIAVERGLITEGQVKEALEIQKNEAAKGEHRPLGTILYEMGLMTVNQVHEMLNSI